MGREFELKYQAGKDVLEAVGERFGPFTTITMETAYYDTADHVLAERKWMLRLRLENGKSVCTLKTPLPDGSRGEWEAECGSIEGAIPMLCGLGAPKELTELTAPGLVETCSARFTRQAAALELDGCTVELALDQGALYGGGREEPVSELEVELKAGSEEAATRFAQELAAEYSLKAEPKSKVQRARTLAGF